MWHELVKRWLDLCSWWVPRKAKEPPKEEIVASPGAEEGVLEDVGKADEKSAEESAQITEDDLTLIKGIGPGIQQKLRSFAIATFADLAMADPEELTEKLRASQPISVARVRGWVAAARDRSNASR